MNRKLPPLLAWQLHALHIIEAEQVSVVFDITESTISNIFRIKQQGWLAK